MQKCYLFIGLKVQKCNIEIYLLKIRSNAAVRAFSPALLRKLNENYIIVDSGDGPGEIDG